MRSERNRNFLGAFLGGILGILAFAYLAAPLLPIGCLVGVVTGYWYDVIWIKARASFRVAAAKSASTRTKFQSLRAEAWRKITVIGRIAWLTLVIVLAVPRWVRGLPYVGWLKFVTWLNKDPRNQIQAIYIAAVFSAAAITAPIFMMYFFRHGLATPRWLSWFAVPVSWLFSMMAIMMGSPEEQLKSNCVTILNIPVQRSYFVPIDLYREEGGRKLYEVFLRGALNLFCLGVINYAIMFLSVAVWVAYALGIYATIAGFILLLRGLWRISSRAEHWLALSVTLIVTTTCALVMRDHLASATLWLTALVAGSISGMATELVRKTVQSWLAWSDKSVTMHQTLLRPIGKQLRPARYSLAVLKHRTRHALRPLVQAIVSYGVN